MRSAAERRICRCSLPVPLLALLIVACSPVSVEVSISPFPAPATLKPALTETIPQPRETLVSQEIATAGEEGQATAPDPPWFATKMAVETALMETRQAAPLTPYPWTLWTPTRDLRPPASTPTPWFVDPHRLAPGGWIVWGGGADYGMICYKFNPEENPYTVVNFWRDIDGPVMVEAGAYGSSQPRMVGAVFTEGPHPCEPDVHLAPFSEGALEIIDVVGNVLLLRAQATGRLISFDADVEQYVEPIQTATPSAP